MRRPIYGYIDSQLARTLPSSAFARTEMKAKPLSLCQSLDDVFGDKNDNDNAVVIAMDEAHLKQRRQRQHYTRVLGMQ